MLTAFLRIPDRKNPHVFRRAFFKLDEANDYVLSGADSLYGRMIWGRRQAADLHAIWKYANRRMKSAKPTKCASLAILRSLRNSLRPSTGGTRENWMEPDSDADIGGSGMGPDSDGDIQSVSSDSSLEDALPPASIACASVCADIVVVSATSATDNAALPSAGPFAADTAALPSAGACVTGLAIVSAAAEEGVVHQTLQRL